MRKPANSGDPLTEDFSKGPAVGEPLPDFELPDQRGRPVRFSERAAGRRALILFYRSASW